MRPYLRAKVDADQKTFDHFMNLVVLLEALLHRRIELVTTDDLVSAMLAIESPL
jgi:predicted nucleotidyltransferase